MRRNDIIHNEEANMQNQQTKDEEHIAGRKTNPASTQILKGDIDKPNYFLQQWNKGIPNQGENEVRCLDVEGTHPSQSRDTRVKYKMSFVEVVVSGKSMQVGIDATK